MEAKMEPLEDSCCYSEEKANQSKRHQEIQKSDLDGDNKRSLMSRYKDIFISASLIIGGFIIFIAALRNTLTHYLQLFWGVSGDFWMRQWGKVYDYFEGDVLSIAFAMWAAIIIQYWVVCSFFLLIDFFQWPTFFLKYKIQEGQNEPVPPAKFRRAVWTVITNQTLVVAPIAYGMYHYMQWRGCGFNTAELPTFQWVMLELFVFLIIEEAGFYYSHRLSHHPRLYKHIHKKHHEWTAPISIIAIYAHPIEHIFSNTLPAILGPMIMGSHVATMTMWLMIAQASAINSHCGYHLPLFPSPEAHDFHHLKFTNNYGTLGILDRFHGTDNLFRKTKAYERHFLLLGLTPVSNQIPDDPKRNKELCGKKD